MESRIENELQLRLLDRARAAFLPATPAEERSGEHLHYDRNAHAWRTHEELGRLQTVARVEPDTALAGCA
jgi:hypothetical protein